MQQESSAADDEFDLNVAILYSSNSGPWSNGLYSPNATQLQIRPAEIGGYSVYCGNLDTSKIL